MVQRLQYRRHNHYNTESNKVRIVKTPGNKLIFQNVCKKASRPKCGDCHKPLPGMPAIRPHKLKWTHKRERTVSRAYGGSVCHKCVQHRIIRAFLLEEQKCVKLVLKERERQKKEEVKNENKRSQKGKKTKKSKN